MACISLAKSRSSSSSLERSPSSKKKLFSLSLTGCLKPSPPRFSATPARDVRLKEFQEVFRYFDKNGDGKISDTELRSFFESMGEDADDVGGDGVLDFGEFVGLMGEGEEERVKEEDLRRAFEMFEVEKGSGCITPHGLQRMFSRLGEPRSVQECEAMIRSFDLDGCARFPGVLEDDELNLG